MRFDKKIHLFLACLLLVVFGMAAVGQAAGLKERMLARLPAINALKAQGLVGEDNKGYLAFVTASREKEDVVTAENSDRRQVYDAIAKQQATSVDLVGSRRAGQIAELAKPGEWLQNGDGTWYRK